MPGLKCVEYSSRPGFGTNYRIRATEAENSYLHLNVYKPAVGAL
jgi:hypothetical protein